MTAQTYPRQVKVRDLRPGDVVGHHYEDTGASQVLYFVARAPERYGGPKGVRVRAQVVRSLSEHYLYADDGDEEVTVLRNRGESLDD